MFSIAVALEYPILQTGGVEVLCRAMVPALSEHFRVVLVSDDTPESLAEAGLAGKVDAHFRWTFGHGKKEHARELAAFLRRHHVRLAHFHFGGPFAWGIRLPWNSPLYHAHRTGIPVVFTNHWVRGRWDGYCGEYKPFWFKLLLFPGAWLARLHNLSIARRELTVSRADQRVERRNVWPLGAKVSQLYHSLLEDTGEPPPKQRPPSILNIGTLAPRKGQDVLVEAFCRIAQYHPEWTLTLAGRGDDEFIASLNHRIQSSSLESRFQYLGEIRDSHRVVELMRSASIYAMPSRSEGLGLSLQEALFHGCACIGTSAGGIPELIEDGQNGLLVPPGDPVALANSLEHLIRERETRKQLAANGPESIRKKGMTRQAMVDAHRELYGGMMGGG